MSDKISVIVPVYNVEPYLERCLDSIINNTYRNLEIICVNDGSTDGCGAILDRYGQMDERITVITQENGGLSAARNSGMDVATGDFIAFIDSDDWIHPQYFEILLYLQKKENCDLVICGFERPKDIEEYKIYDVTEVKGTLLDLEGIYRNHSAKSYAWGKLYQRGLVCEKRFIEGVRIAEDAAFNALVLGSKEEVKAYYTQTPLYFYYDRPGSLVYMLKGKETLALGSIFEQYEKETTLPRVKRILLIEVLKRGLSARYVLSLRPEDCEYKKYGDTMIRRGVRALWQLSNVTCKEKLLYAVFGYFPFTYRLFRIIDDPTLLAMEKEMKKNRTT